ncbi:MAG: peptidoglycan DD-metalloendopeptidase family protein [Limnobacter sp.]|uniref:Peptidoglycan DD-metalloendopeptidase family protein n=1 Tax=Limnobacter profundi TaxID=2732163 RepID=A0ABX6N7H0_9BURK|nr:MULTISPECIES: peptidoglycan DD-metalloendopeptidase family protein [unclassified Limnobacter]MDP3272439.1 peptidoglycan DD-metalloendopeptidase family protein [Limnobacter sp.]MDZ4050180.1 peptidoglycan DD-metalloendopeptidase family protein [Limnobacter sp.]QJR30340.1 peptidoglycan DD-metalloendopeptidase family protein [Limnobacter sp. SAORIC-580]
MVAIAGSVQNSPVDSALGNPDVVVEAVELNLADQGVYTFDPLVAEERIRRGDTLVGLLERMGVNTAGLATFLGQDKTARNLVNLRAGRVLTVQQTADGDLQWLRYKSGIDEDSQESILIQKRNGQFVAKLESVNFEKQIVFRSGRIESSLFAAADKAGMPDSVAIQLTEIFGSDIDFHRELQKGDEFKVVYEDLTLEGRSARSGRVLAVEFVNNNKPYKAYWFAPSGNRNAGYYNEEGRSLKKSFLRSPLAFSRISSGFTPRRFHPIQQRWKAHNGVDYAAPTGTPIMATASGTVKFSGWQNGYGNFVEIQHHSGYSTAYAHLSRFGKGVKVGQKVEQGDVIGYVGATGWATGPHLHYEFRVNRVPKNPLSITVAQAEPLDRNAFSEFKRVQLALDRRMELATAQRLARAQ